MNPRVARVLLIRTWPGTTAAFEEHVMRRLQAAVPAWTFQPQPMEQARATILRGYAAPVAAAALVAGFLVLMVALGLSGVLWMSVTQRTRKIGLRRAKGATGSGIQRQVIGEVLVLTSVAVVAGVLVVAQFPLLDVFGPVPPGVYVIGLALAVACIFLVSVAAAWAPSRMASSIDPAEALRYE